MGQKHGEQQRPCCQKSKDSSTTVRKIMNIRWFDKVRNEDLWQGASQDPINTQIKKEEMGMDWPHTEETTKQHHQTDPQMEPTR